MIRLMLVEDSLTIREFLTAIVGQDPEIEIVAFAKNGLESLKLLEKHRPDVVLMDINMPVMDGLEATRRIMESIPTPVVIMSATCDVKEVELAMDAVSAGALALLEKPLSFEGASQQINEFIATVKAMSAVKVVKRRHCAPNETEAQFGEAPDRCFEVIGIATSTGGPPALAKILSSLPADFPFPILVVQHIVKGFMPGMVAWLDGLSRLRVTMARHGETINTGCVYLADDGFHLGIDGQKRLLLIDAPPVGGFRPSANILFESLADTYGERALAIILTGMGRDGVAGLQRLRNRRGTIIAQDETSCAVFGMPQAAIEAGLADSVLSLSGIGEYLMNQGRSS